MNVFTICLTEMSGLIYFIYLTVSVSKERLRDYTMMPIHFGSATGAASQMRSLHRNDLHFLGGSKRASNKIKPNAAIERKLWLRVLDDLKRMHVTRGNVQTGREPEIKLGERHITLRRDASEPGRTVIVLQDTIKLDLKNKMRDDYVVYKPVSHKDKDNKLDQLLLRRWQNGPFDAIEKEMNRIVSQYDTYWEKYEERKEKYETRKENTTRSQHLQRLLQQDQMI